MPGEERSPQDLKELAAALQAELSKLEDEGRRQKAVKTLCRWQSFPRPYAKRGSKWFIYFYEGVYRDGAGIGDNLCCLRIGHNTTGIS